MRVGNVPRENTIEVGPSANQLWKGIGGHFESFGQVLCEFIDNSISNLEGNAVPNRTVVITLSELPNETVGVSIEDNGTGIADLGATMRIGDTTAVQTTLNEHGFGLKHALAHANPNNDSWKLATRTGNDVCTLVEAPYSFQLRTKVIPATEITWPGEFSGTGTWIFFECSATLFYTLRRGVPGRPAGFSRSLDYLCEDLGFTYAGLIGDGKVCIRVVSNGYCRNVEPVLPTWRDGHPRTIHVQHDLGGGEIGIKLQFGLIEKSTHRKYYKVNQATSGLEVRFNGRAMGTGLFQEVWNREVHPQYNRFLAIVNLESENRDALPRTVTSKTRPRDDDKKRKALLEWVAREVGNPLTGEIGIDIPLEALVHELAEKKKREIDRDRGGVEEDFKIFASYRMTAHADLYVYDGQVAELYKAKKEFADVRDLYQLLMCWDGAVTDGQRPDRGILIAAAFAPGLNRVLDMLNELTDYNGNMYRFMTRTWHAEGIPYPKGTGDEKSKTIKRCQRSALCTT